jgi:hypothetical protein
MSRSRARKCCDKLREALDRLSIDDSDSPPRMLSVKVYTGGWESVQSKVFRVAASQFAHRAHFHYISAYDVRTANNGTDWTLAQLCAWLKSGDCYFILSHPHQGLDGPSGWDLNTMEDDLVRELEGKAGFPKALGCSIFSQVIISSF